MPNITTETVIEDNKVKIVKLGLTLSEEERTNRTDILQEEITNQFKEKIDALVTGNGGHNVYSGVPDDIGMDSVKIIIFDKI